MGGKYPPVKICTPDDNPLLTLNYKCCYSSLLLHSSYHALAEEIICLEGINRQKKSSAYKPYLSLPNFFSCIMLTQPNKNKYRIKKYVLITKPFYKKSSLLWKLDRELPACLANTLPLLQPGRQKSWCEIVSSSCCYQHYYINS